MAGGWGEGVLGVGVAVAEWGVVVVWGGEAVGVEVSAVEIGVAEVLVVEVVVVEKLAVVEGALAAEEKVEKVIVEANEAGEGMGLAMSVGCLVSTQNLRKQTQTPQNMQHLSMFHQVQIANNCILCYYLVENLNCAIAHTLQYTCHLPTSKRPLLINHSPRPILV